MRISIEPDVLLHFDRRTELRGLREKALFNSLRLGETDEAGPRRRGRDELSGEVPVHCETEVRRRCALRADAPERPLAFAETRRIGSIIGEEIDGHAPRARGTIGGIAFDHRIS